MIVVSDTTPIITLLKIGRLDLLKLMYGSVKIPEAVFTELTQNPIFFNEAEIIRNCDFLQVTPVQDESKVSLLQKATGLDLGESEALTLCLESHSDLLLMDEAHGRMVAKQLGISMTGVVGVIATAYKRAILSKDDILNYVALLKDSDRFISPKFLQYLIDLTK
ncbi:MAG: hypothetical protein MJY87_06500 [Fibrobacter sp.]|uniref:hypothetical protein n=1 Tax=Fibrobacter sp. UWEL TaxID=1896209 RepID=UPI00091A3B67|nr:hypothetical protein [Fibrobacter sp. UWEL]MCQ2097577.1 hypothetical protein [Fibrobacter sp.]SHL54118.1 hypothetical protein SAMN05720468_1433 [Fibrobacter sp. UWEL]